MVGSVCCRIEKEANGDKKLYIMTLGCLDAYRRLGVGMSLGVNLYLRTLSILPNLETRCCLLTLICRPGTLMLNHILKQCEKDGKITEVFLHVQADNDAALKFYEKFGFTITRHACLLLPAVDQFVP